MVCNYWYIYLTNMTKNKETIIGNISESRLHWQLINYIGVRHG